VTQSAASFLASGDNPELSSLSIRMPSVFVSGMPLTFRNFLSYELHDHFLKDSDGWSFTLARDDMSSIDVTALTPRAAVEVAIDDVVISRGYIDEITVRSDAHGGSIVTVEGRDWLSPAVDSHVDPNTRFTSSMTLDQMLTAVFAPFGMTVLAIDNIANRNAKTGRVYGEKVSKSGKPLKSYVLHELKPYQQEGAFQFAARVSQRFGLWLWPAADGKTLICGKPEFDQDARYQLLHKAPTGAQNNVIESHVSQSGRDQPTCILSCGFGGGGDFPRSTLRSGVINPLVDGDISPIIDKYPQVKFLTPSLATSAVEPITEPNNRPLYIYDPESHSQDQLDAFTLRELSLLMRKSLTAHYTIEGHKLNGQNVVTDTIVSVDDDVSNLHLPLWVIGVSYSKRGGAQGTTTTLECIRPGTLTF
jgi:prophage tail gpP-like protein